MSKLCFKTRNDTSPQGKPRVYFSCHKDDFKKYFEEISEMILKSQNCCIYYYENIEGAEGEERELDLSQIQLFVIPVTENFLAGNNKAFDFDFKYAAQHHIPVLPLLQDAKLTALFNEKCGNLQYLIKNDEDETAIPFDIKFENYLNSVLVGDEMAEKIRAAFDAYVFLSYRKKDRKYAQELMRLIHKNEFCRDIAIWYDEFLVPGENFNDAISDAMNKSKLFALVVTPNLVNEENYVMTTEYPMARNSKMPLLPAESVPTDKKLLAEKFENLPECTDVHDEEKMTLSLAEALKGIAVRTNDSSPEHNFFIGLAYLSGIDVEVDHERAVKLISSAAEMGLCAAAEKLANMYKIGEGVSIDYENAIKWQKKATALFKEEWQKSESAEDRRKYLESMQKLCFLHADLNHHDDVIENATEILKEGKNVPLTNRDKAFMMDVANRVARSYQALRKYDEAEKTFKACIMGYEQLYEKKPDSYTIGLSTAYNNIALLYKKMARFDEAENYFVKAMELREKKNAEHPGVYDRRCAVVYENLGDMYYDKKEYKKAEEIYLKALHIRERIAKTGNDSTLDNLADSLVRISNIYFCTERYGECEKIRLRAFEIRKKLNDKNPVLYEDDYVSSLNGLGNLYRETGRYEKAEEMFLKSLKINERRKNENPVIFEEKYARSCHFIGIVYRTMARYDEACKYFLESIEIKEKLQAQTPESHSDTLAAGYSQLAHTYRRAAKPDKAIEYYQKAIKLREEQNERNQGVYDGNLSGHYSGLAGAYSDIGENIKAEQYFLKGLRIRERLCEENYAAYGADVSLTCNDLGVHYAKVGENEKSLEYYFKSLKIREKLAEENPAVHMSEIATLKHNIAVRYRVMKKYAEAEEMYLSAIEIREKLYEANPGANIGNLALYYSNIGFLYSETGKTKEAEIYYKKSVGIREDLCKKSVEIYGEGFETACYNLAGMYISEGKYVKAVKMYIKATNKGQTNDKDDTATGIAVGLTKIANDFSAKGKNIMATVLYKKAVKLQTKAYEKNPKKYAEFAADVYKGAGDFYKKMKKYRDADRMYLKKISVRRIQCKSRDAKCIKQLATDLNTLGEFYEEITWNNKAIKAYEESITKWRKISEGSDENRGKLALSINNLHVFKRRIGIGGKEYEMLFEAIKINSELGKSKRGALAVNYFNLGYVYREFGENEKEIESFETALVIYKELALENPNKYQKMVTETEKCIERAKSKS